MYIFVLGQRKNMDQFNIVFPRLPFIRFLNAKRIFLDVTNGTKGKQKIQFNFFVLLHQ